MKPALLLVFFLPCAQAAPIKATGAQQDEIMSHIRKGLKARDRAIEFKSSMEEMKLYPEIWEQLSWEQNAASKEAATELNLAIEQTLEYYSIAPDGLKFGESNAARQGPMIGAPIQWAPTVLDDIHLSFQYTDANNNLRHGGGPFTENDGGTTWVNGQVSINIDMLTRALDYDHPGALAYVLHHEAQHFEDMVTQPEKTKQEGEVSSYEASLAAVDVFELGATGGNASTTKFGSW